MASVGNAFDLLIGTGEQVVASKKKKKSKAKPKPAADGQAAGVPAATPQGQADQKGDETVQEVPVAEASALLEKSARTFKSGPDRVKLWKDWIKQAGVKGSQAIKYTDANDAVIDFKELVLRSRALEITIESCISSPILHEQTSHLQQLLQTFLPHADTHGLAAAVGRLAELLGEDSHSYDTVGAAQRALNSAVSALKTTKDKAGPKKTSVVTKLNKIDENLDKHQAFLNKMQNSSVSKQHVESASEMVRLQAEKFDLLQPAGAGAARGDNPVLQGALNSLQELKDVITNHLKEARALEERSTLGSGGKDTSGAQALAAIKREEGMLAQQANDVASQVRALEAQLAGLRAQAADIEERRKRLAQRQQAALQAAGAAGRARGPGGASLLSAAHYQDQLSTAEALVEALDPSAAGEEGEALAAARGQYGEVCLAYMACLRQLLSINSNSMADVPGKIGFCKERISKAEKLAALGGTKMAKQKEDAEKLLEDTLKNAEDLLHSSGQAVEGMRRRFHILNQVAQETAAALSSQAYEIEDMMQHTRGQYELVLAVARGQAPPQAPPLAPAPAAVPPPGPAVGALGGAPLAMRPLQPGVLGGQPLLPPGAVGAPPIAAPVGVGLAGVTSRAPGGPVKGPVAAPGAPLVGLTPAAGIVGAPVVPSSNGAAAAGGAAVTSNGSSAHPPAGGKAVSRPPADGFQQVAGKKNRRKA